MWQRKQLQQLTNPMACLLAYAQVTPAYVYVCQESDGFGHSRKVEELMKYACKYVVLPID